MADGSKIEWTEATWNPLRAVLCNGARIGWHCEHASPGCANCYAETMNEAGRSVFTGTRLPFKPGHRKDVSIYVDPKKLAEPLKWKRGRMIFVCSMTDLFGDFHTDEMIDQVFAVMGDCPQHTFQVLTKRADRMRAYLTARKSAPPIAVTIPVGLVAQHPFNSELKPPSNIWLGVSVEDQQRANERIPDLLQTPAAVRWLSCEPLLGPVDLTAVEYYPGFFCDALSGTCVDGVWPVPADLDWIVVGGESGPNARPMHPDWARPMRDQCQAAGVPFFFKQWGNWREAEPGDQFDTAKGKMNKPAAFIVKPDDGTVHCFLPENASPRCRVMLEVGKKAAGRLLDGVEHNGMPEIVA